MRAIMSWLNSHLNLITAVVLVGVLLLMILQMSNVSEQAKVNAKLLSNQAQLLKQIHIDGEARSKAVDDLLKDNSAQTVILCKLIVSSNLKFQDNDAAQIETICKQKIKDAVDSTSAPTPATVTRPTTVTQPATPTTTPTTSTTTPPATTTPTPTPPVVPPQSVIPFIKKPLVGCVTLGICL